MIQRAQEPERLETEEELSPECTKYEIVIDWDGMVPENPYCQDDLDYDLGLLKKEFGDFDFYSCPSGNPCKPK